MGKRRVVSHHFFRRTARKKVTELNNDQLFVVGVAYHVERARRGPYVWVVVEYDQR